VRRTRLAAHVAAKAAYDRCCRRSRFVLELGCFAKFGSSLLLCDCVRLGSDRHILHRGHAAAGSVGSRSADPFVVRGPKLRLNAASAQAIGLALHELATNAGKYGALSVDRGQVDVGWGTDGNVFTMGWTERDGPAVSPPERRGFGTIVMQEMAERSVGGSVELNYAPSGVTWRLTCPAAGVLESSRHNARRSLAGVAAEQLGKQAGKAPALATSP
jgi:hypothetical protein